MTRVIMSADLHAPFRPPSPKPRPYSIGDRAQLGTLLFEAYLGTIDQEEETVEQAQAEIEKTIAGEYGEFLPASSRIVERSGLLHSAAMLTRFRGRPFIAYAMTRPASKNQGLARACIGVAMGSLRDQGEREVHLVVTLANAPAVRLYQSLGFLVERDA